MDVMERLADLAGKIALDDLNAGVPSCMAFCLLCLVAACVCHGAVWFTKLSCILALGYPAAKKRKARERILKKYPWYKHILLTELVKNAPNKNSSLWFYWTLNLINCILFFVAFVSCSLVFITKGSGWTITLALEVPVGYFLISNVIEFIPDLVLFKSERARYKFR